jgi:hypothetical protein
MPCHRSARASSARYERKGALYDSPNRHVAQAFLGAALLINLRLMLIVVEGAGVLQTAAASTGGALPCGAWYNHPVVHDYQ